VSSVSGASQIGEKTVVGASRSRRDRARERDAPTTKLQLGDTPSVPFVVQKKYDKL
jgi:hypothetical protein